MTDVTVPTLLDLETAGVKAWPALETRPIGGWLWRCSTGGSQRANSVATLADPAIALDDAIEEAERLYFERGVPPQFQITDVAVPAGLDARLARRGYRINDPCTTLACPLEHQLVAPTDIVVTPRATLGWFETYASVITPNRRRVAPSILEQIPAESGFVGLHRDGEVIATALVVLDRATAIAECVATRQDARRTGAAEAVMRGAMAWAQAHGARVMALGAVASNAPAQALYAKLGFRVAGRYHMRIRD